MPHRQEVQRIIVGSTVSGGAFLLSMGSEAATGQAQTSFSLPIAWNASAAAVQQALKVLPVQLTADQVCPYLAYAVYSRCRLVSCPASKHQHVNAQGT